MIQSLFETEDLPEDKNKSSGVEDKIVELPDSGEVSAKNAGNREVLTSETHDIQLPAEASTDSTEDVKNGFIENTENEELLDSNSEPESENFIKEIEFGDNFLEMEKKLTEIEDQVRLENAEKIEEITQKENLRTFENKAKSEKTEPPQLQQGIFTSAINKAKQEQQTVVPLENLLIIPAEIQTDSEVLPPENQGFILPNRIAPTTENESFTEPQTSQADYKPESKAELIRKSGMAWSVGIAFFASVVFLLILGWFADLLLGTSPWGAVVGVILGSIIGFVQLFRLTSQILKNNE